jgi:hypothetical protein
VNRRRRGFLAGLFALQLKVFGISSLDADERQGGPGYFTVGNNWCGEAWSGITHAGSSTPIGRAWTYSEKACNQANYARPPGHIAARARLYFNGSFHSQGSIYYNPEKRAYSYAEFWGPNLTGGWNAFTDSWIYNNESGQWKYGSVSSPGHNLPA